MVRLKLPIPFIAGAALAGFQFHYGSIKINVPLESYIQYALFQFHYGSIKIYYKLLCQFLLSRFNSTMVRLKFNEVSTAIPQPPLFQFHYGSIKIDNIEIAMLQDEYVSIPLWFD